MTRIQPTDLKTEAQEEEPIIHVGRIQKPPPAKKGWTKLRSGLFGWKYTAQPTKPSKGFTPRTSGKMGNVVKESPKNKTSETWQDKPPEILFFGGGGKMGPSLSEKTKVYKQRDRVSDRVWAEKSLTSAPNTGGHSGVSGVKKKCGKFGSL